MEEGHEYRGSADRAVEALDQALLRAYVKVTDERHDLLFICVAFCFKLVFFKAEIVRRYCDIGVLFRAVSV